MPGWRLPAGRQGMANAMKSWYVYILRSLEKKEYYKGMTGDLEMRLKQHSSDEVKTTKKMRPFQLIHVEICNSKE